MLGGIILSCGIKYGFALFSCKNTYTKHKTYSKIFFVIILSGPDLCVYYLGCVHWLVRPASRGFIRISWWIFTRYIFYNKNNYIYNDFVCTTIKFSCFVILIIVGEVGTWILFPACFLFMPSLEGTWRKVFFTILFFCTKHFLMLKLYTFCMCLQGFVAMSRNHGWRKGILHSCTKVVIGTKMRYFYYIWLCFLSKSAFWPVKTVRSNFLKNKSESRLAIRIKLTVSFMVKCFLKIEIRWKRIFSSFWKS